MAETMFFSDMKQEKSIDFVEISYDMCVLIQITVASVFMIEEGSWLDWSSSERISSSLWIKETKNFNDED